MSLCAKHLFVAAKMAWLPNRPLIAGELGWWQHWQIERQAPGLFDLAFPAFALAALDVPNHCGVNFHRLLHQVPAKPRLMVIARNRVNASMG